MNDDIERRLRRVTPLGAPAELRSRVLAAVAGPLQAPAPLPSRWSFRPALFVAASLLASLALNFWVSDRLDRRLAMVLGPPPERKRTAEIVVGGPANDAARQYAVRLQKLIQQLALDIKESADEAPRKNSQVDGDRHGSRDHHPADAQCLLRVEYRYRA
jgi:hypothetical protein